ncbi:methyltransferase [uncultured Psychrosphaera sp.]|uniref:methyltransferase n=1 Tax=uncultured Psychrosphaera sp. TaxID=1403522 RepID=UPI00261B4C65|nr:methyltransferase [uncultured Psychrosphaera sp.]
MLFAENQVVERNIDHLPAGNVLLLDLLNDDAIAEFSEQRSDINWFGFTPYVDTQQLNKKNNVVFGAWLEEEQVNNTKFDAVVIYFPKTKLRFDYYLSMVSKHLNKDATIYIVGEKKGGVKSCDKALESYCDVTAKLDGARHCMLFTATFNNHVCTKTMEDWFSTSEVTVEIEKQAVTVQLVALPGVFSANSLDNGTQLLLNTITDVKGHGLDFGCGCGVISVALAKRYDCSMTAIDVDALAVESSNKTFAVNNVDAKAKPSNGLSAVLSSGEFFKFIVTNPPFHTGTKTDYTITEQLIKHAPKMLKRKYQFWMVANAFLPYPELFKQHFKYVEVKNKNKRFNIYYTGRSS